MVRLGVLVISEFAAKDALTGSDRLPPVYTFEPGLTWRIATVSCPPAFTVKTGVCVRGRVKINQLAAGFQAGFSK